MAAAGPLAAELILCDKNRSYKMKCVAPFYPFEDSKMFENRFEFSQPDYIFVVIRKPQGWRPSNYFDVPPSGRVLSKSRVASYAEAHDDLVRCNRLSLHRSLDRWAVIQTADVEI
jgi:hypothetical protein